MAFTDTLSKLMPTFFPIKANGGSLPMPVGTGRNFFWGNGSGPLYPGGGINVGRSLDYAQAARDEHKHRTNETPQKPGTLMTKLLLRPDLDDWESKTTERL